jgi:hypothetical protein
MPPAFRRGWEGEGKPEIAALARAGGHSPQHGGVYLRFRTNDGTLARREADERPARGPVGQRASGNKRGKSACGLARERRALRSTSQDVWDRARPPESPAQSEAAPDRHPNGPGLQARSAQRIEQVARKGSPPTRSAVCKDESVLCKRNLRDEQNINNKWLYDST